MITPTILAPHIGSDALDCVAVTEVEGTTEIEVRGMDRRWVDVARARLRRAGFRCRKIRGGDHGSSYHFRVLGVVR